MGNKQIRTNQKLTDNLILPEFFAWQLGYESFSLLMEDLKNAEEGYNSNGISYFCERISSKGSDIRKYDLKIKNYVVKIGRERGQKFSLKYFQYIAVLFTEMYLEKLSKGTKDEKKKFIEEINRFIEEKNLSGSKKYSLKDLNPPKLAYYMATGSGKTIIMHINYLQFIDYIQRNGIRIDNCILITPSEHMTRQHINELRKSRIDAIEFHGLTLDTFSTDNFTIKVIDINKLKDVNGKKGQGVSVDISSFGSYNLILVDEGHKGYSTEERIWANIRNKLSENGFALEYSGTFEQAVSKDPDLYDLYSRAIIMDYSYKHFYNDGYGKDFNIINLEKAPIDEKETRNTLLLANSLTYLSQLLAYNDRKDLVKKYSIERPLWIFVGSKVNVSDKNTTSDIIDVIDFINWVISPANKEGVIKKLSEILNGKTGIIDKNGNDVFSKEYEEKLFLEQIRNTDNLEKLYENILKNVFKCNNTGNLEIKKIIKAEGEIGLKCGSEYFGVIDVGDRDEFLKNLQEKIPEINKFIKDDHFENSLFYTINENPEKINILIGAKKFIEGWDTKRVSSMCLLNIGKNEGAQIIQLFGRGVRLNGLENSMKREINPCCLELKMMQTLHIYGIKASYLKTFKDEIKQSVLYTPTKIKIVNNFKKRQIDLDIINFKDKVLDEYKTKSVNLAYSNDIIPKVDLISTAEVISSSEEALKTISDYKNCIIPSEILNLLNWNKIYFNIIDFKFNSGYLNLAINPTLLDNLIENIFYKNSSSYELYLEPKYCQEFSLDHIEKIENAVFEILKEYIKKFYEKKFREFVSIGDKEYEKSKFNDNNIPEEYVVYIDNEVVQKYEIPRIINLKNYLDLPINIKEINTEYKGYEVSLYTPLIYYNKNDKFYTIPAGLNEGEKNFVEDFIKYLNDNQNNFQNFEFYLYRNPSRSGYHFYVFNETIYPDFILWVRKCNSMNKEQVLVYIEPHGLIFSDPNNDPKLNLPRLLKNNYSNQIQGLYILAFIISVTPKSKLKNLKNFTKLQDLFFQDDKEYIKKILNEILEKFENK